MATRTVLIDGSNQNQMKAACFASDCQGAVNLIAITGAFLGHLKILREGEVCGDDLNNHPVVLAFTSKLMSLCRIETDDRLTRAFEAVDRVSMGNNASYEVIEIN